MRNLLNMITHILIDRHIYNAEKSTPCQRLFVTSVVFFYLAPTWSLVTFFTVHVPATSDNYWPSPYLFIFFIFVFVWVDRIFFLI